MIFRLFLAFVCCLLAVPSFAQKPAPIGTYKKWSAYTLKEAEGIACYMASAPTQSLPKNVRRGKIWVLVTHRPWRTVKNEVSFYSGYPFKKGSKVRVIIDKKSYSLFTHEDTAWADTPELDGTLVKEMRKGLRMEIRGVSSRGTNTTDRFSLSGFTAAHKAINKACNIR